MLGPGTVTCTINLLLSFSCFLILHEAAAEAGTQRLPTFKDQASICPSQTINYITHSLPQQCLKTSWSRELIVGVIKNERVSVSQTATHTEPARSSTSSATAAVKAVSTNPANQSSSQSENSSAQASNPTVSKIETESTIQTSTSQGAEKTETVPADNDVDPLSDTTNFLSFEDWKAQMLEKAGQSPEHVRGAPNIKDHPELRRRSSGINNALDAIGDDAEIELNFSGFVDEDTASSVLPQKPYATPRQGDERFEREQEEARNEPVRQSREAGTTSKERFNYASFDCAATILKTNPKCKGSNAVLAENKDSYLLNRCSEKNKFFIIELCNDILIDTVVLANFEFFSSTFRAFRVSISDRYPVKIDKWREIGTFEARNTRALQAFLVENALIWARFLRIEFLTHYGNEYYCPVSLVRVHGKTMMDDYKNDFKAARGEEDPDDDVSATEGGINEGSDASVVVAEVLKTGKKTIEDNPTPTSQENDPETTITSALESSVAGQGSQATVSTAAPSLKNNALSTLQSQRLLLKQRRLLLSTCSVDDFHCDVENVKVTRPRTTANTGDVTRALNPGSTTLKEFPSSPTSVTKEQSPETKANSTKPSVNSTISSLPNQTSISSVSNQQNTTAAAAAVTTAISKAQANTTTQSATKVSQQPPPAAPSTQESFFKSIHKRLQQLEVNSTLSLQYIEEQSRILREAFAKVEKRQLGKTTTFLESLNTTVLSELQNFRLQYDQIWQSTVLELSAQREQSQREVVALSARLGILADEILFQKRMAILQFVLILLCLGLVLFSRSPSNAVLDLPSAVQNMVVNPSTSFSRYLHSDSPPGTPSRPSSRYGLFSRGTRHFRSPSNESTLNDNNRLSPDIEYSPPTPPSERSGRSDLGSRDPAASADASSALRRAMSAPAVPTQHGDSDSADLTEDEAMDDASPSREIEVGSQDGPYDHTENATINGPETSKE